MPFITFNVSPDMKQTNRLLGRIAHVLESIAKVRPTPLIYCLSLCCFCSLFFSRLYLMTPLRDTLTTIHTYLHISYLLLFMLLTM